MALICCEDDIVKGKPTFPSSASAPYVNCSKEKSCVKKCVSLMEYETLESATNNFQESEILGKGGFSCVYKGKLEDNLFVAVKKLQEGVTQDDAIQEFEVGGHCFTFTAPLHLKLFLVFIKRYPYCRPRWSY